MRSCYKEFIFYREMNGISVQAVLNQNSYHCEAFYNEFLVYLYLLAGPETSFPSRLRMPTEASFSDHSTAKMRVLRRSLTMRPNLTTQSRQVLDSGWLSSAHSGESSSSVPSSKSYTMLCCLSVHFFSSKSLKITNHHWKINYNWERWFL